MECERSVYLPNFYWAIRVADSSSTQAATTWITFKYHWEKHSLPLQHDSGILKSSQSVSKNKNIYDESRSEKWKSQKTSTKNFPHFCILDKRARNFFIKIWGWILNRNTSWIMKKNHISRGIFRTPLKKIFSLLHGRKTLRMEFFHAMKILLKNIFKLELVDE